MSLGIRGKLLGGSLIAVLLMAVLTVYSLIMSQNYLRESVGTSTVVLVEEMLKRIDQDIYLKLELLQTHAGHLPLRDTLAASNDEFEQLDDVEEHIAVKEREWVVAADSEMTLHMQALINNALADSLREEFFEYYEQEYGYRVFAEVTVTNKYGVSVAQTGRTANFDQRKREWWQGAWNAAHFVGDVEYDENTGKHGIRIAARIIGREGDYLGVIQALVASEDIIREAEIAVKRYQTTAVTLTTKDGHLIYASRAFKFLEDVVETEFFANITGQAGYFTAQGGERRKLFSYTRSKGYRDYSGHGWILIMEHDEAEVLKPATTLRNRNSLASLLLIVISVVAALLIARGIASHINQIRDAAVEIAHGNLDRRATVTATDETGELAAAFNRMAAELKHLYTDLDKRVNERTAELRRANQQLSQETAERKQAQDALKEYSERLEEMVEERTQELKEAEKQLVRRNKELEAFSYSVSHDLRAPLRAIIGFTQILAEDFAERLDAEGERQLDVIQGSARKMGQLIDDLLAFSRLGRKEMSKSHLDMKALATEAFEQLRMADPEAGGQMKITELPPAQGDRSMMRQVFTNLLANAIKFSGSQDHAAIEVAGWIEANETIYAVKDNGVGFDMKYADKLFQVFQRLHSSDEYEGTGIGLALVQRIIRRHGGRVWAQGRVNKGATFHFSLPKEKEIKDE